MATAVRTSARHKDESIRAAFQKTLAYNAQIAMKGVKTRRKNAEAASDSSPEADGPETMPDPTGGNPGGEAPAATP